MDVAGQKSDWKASDALGGFVGAEFVPSEAWKLAAEAHLVNEQTVALALIYSF
jgi:hypothetical protein